MNTNSTQGNQNVVIQSVNDSTLTININGEARQVQNEFDEIKKLIQNLKIQHIQYADKIYNIEHINEANFGFIVGKKVVYNQLLTKQLIEAAAAYSPPIKDWLAKAHNQTAHWETQTRISDKAKEIIAFSFAGVIGVQFSKLMAIGKENNTEAKTQDYLRKCMDLAKYGLDLLNFALLSHLWVEKKTQDIPLSIEQQKTLSDFFTSVFELSIGQRLTLFRTLLQVFEACDKALPLLELKVFLQKHFVADSAFEKAVLAMEKLHERIEKGEDTPLDCAEAERELAAMYTPLAFLVRYKMASIKFIHYQQTKQSPPRYLHRYTALGIDSKANIDAEKIYFTSETAETDSVWLYQGDNYKNGINLMPFALDVNALTFERGAKICFFVAQSTEANTFEYVFLDNLDHIKIERQPVSAETAASSEWLMENKNRIVLNFNTAIELMQTIQKDFVTDVNADFDIDFDTPNN